MTLEHLEARPQVRDKSLTDIIIKNYPQDPPEFLEEVRFPIPLLKAENFDDIYAQRQDIQNFNVGLKRPDGNLKFSVEEANKYKKAVEEALEESPVAIVAPTIPYVLTPDSQHLIIWFKEGVDIAERAEFLSTFFAENNIGEEDFIIVSSLKSRRSVKEIDHSHLLLRRPATNC